MGGEINRNWNRDPKNVSTISQNNSKQKPCSCDGCNASRCQRYSGKKVSGVLGSCPFTSKPIDQTVVTCDCAAAIG